MERVDPNALERRLAFFTPTEPSNVLGSTRSTHQHVSALSDQDRLAQDLVRRQRWLGREGEDHDYFQSYSEKIAYPLAINIIF